MIKEVLNSSLFEAADGNGGPDKPITKVKPPEKPFSLLRAITIAPTLGIRRPSESNGHH